MADWYYEDNASQQGPVSDQEMLALLRSGAITTKTRIWSEELASGWTELQSTRLRPLGPPPLPSDITSASAPPPAIVIENASGILRAAEPKSTGEPTAFYAYLIAASPPVVVFLQYVLAAIVGPTQHDTILMIVNYVIGMLPVYFLARKDTQLLAEVGLTKPNNPMPLYVFVMPFFYFMHRTHAINRPNQFIWVWVVCVVFSYYLLASYTG